MKSKTRLKRERMMRQMDADMEEFFWNKLREWYFLTTKTEIRKHWDYDKRRNNKSRKTNRT